MLVLNLSTIVLKMSTELAGNALGAALFGHTRRAVLALLYTRPDESFFLRQISRRVGISPGALQRELVRLAKAGVWQRNVVARQIHYQANHECPIFAELKGLVIKTAGMGDVLR
ncbi:MAG: winged helix-turn-helix domain-containing protein, partial [Candidatus Acidiferrales bacterium]